MGLIERFATHTDYFNGTDFHYIISCSAKLDPNLWDRFQKKFNVKICNMYGLTETVTGGLYCGPADNTIRMGTIGKPIDMEAKIVDENGLELPLDNVGELCLKGKNVTPGYFENKTATNNLFHENWLKTGDLAKIQTDGYIEIIGRKKSVIISGGLNVYAEEINEVLRMHRSIKEAATIGIENSDWGELVVSIIETTVPTNENEIINHCQQHLEQYKVPKKIIFVAKIPTSPIGKPIIEELKNIVITSSSSLHNQSNKQINYDSIISIAANTFQLVKSILTIDSQPADIGGWDSLGNLRLIEATEKAFNIIFLPNEIMKIDSLKSLFNIVQEKKNLAQ